MFNHTGPHIRTLKRRYDYIKKRVDVASFDATWDKAEMAAICEAIHWMELLYTYPWMKEALENAGKDLMKDGKED